MTNTKLITSLMVDGKIIQKNNGQVQLPFGCEYSIYFKNLENKKVSIGITIDGQDILNGSKLLINPKDEMTLERFVDKLDEGRKLRFIEKTQEISEFRGNKAEDGLIVISYQYEAEKIRKGFGLDRRIIGGYETQVYAQANCSANTSLNSLDASYSVKDTSLTRGLAQNSVNDKGITVEGSKSKQNFNRGYIGELEIQEHIEVIELFGYESECGISPDEKTVFVRSKFCPSCGTFYEGDEHVDYCSKDGTYLRSINKPIDLVLLQLEFPNIKNRHVTNC